MEAQSKGRRSTEAVELSLHSVKVVSTSHRLTSSSYDGIGYHCVIVVSVILGKQSLLQQFVDFSSFHQKDLHHGLQKTLASPKALSELTFRCDYATA